MSTTAEILTPPPHGHQPGTARAALSYKGFRVIFFGLALSNIGTWMQNFTLPAYIDSADDGLNGFAPQHLPVSLGSDDVDRAHRTPGYWK